MSITVGIAGITGKFARRVASHLMKNPDVSIRGYCRDPSKVPESISSSDKVTLFKGDAFDRDAIRTFVQGSDVLICCYLGDDKLMVDGQKILIDICEDVGVPRYIASDWALDYTKLKLGELFPKDPMIHVRAHLASKEKVKGVHILIGGFMEPVFSPFFSILDASSHTFRFLGNGGEIMEGTTYDNAAEFTSAVARDTKATGILRCMYIKQQKIPGSSLTENQSSAVVRPSAKLLKPTRMCTASRLTSSPLVRWTISTRPCMISAPRTPLTSTATCRCMSFANPCLLFQNANGG